MKNFIYGVLYTLFVLVGTVTAFVLMYLYLLSSGAK